ncbi:MAG: AAA family ATPase, partial [Cytophagales bacterium]|nr:AAA family ATPase [Cytophagales bacterium]
MLIGLVIKNYALIRELEIHPSPHLNVVTGETGAGKSIMLGAIGLLLGNRADGKALWDENEKCIVEGVFDISSYKLQSAFESANLDYEQQAVIRREISPGGKSRAFINDTPVTLEIMRSIGGRLMDVHSQHETLELGSRVFQLDFIDSYASNLSLKDKYKEAWKSFVVAKTNFESLQKEAALLKQESDFVKFQLEELTKAELQSDEQEKLESELKVM